MVFAATVAFAAVRVGMRSELAWPLRAGFVMLHVAAAYGFVRRRKPRRCDTPRLEDSLHAAIAVVPSMVLGGIVIRLTEETATTLIQALFLAGSLLSTCSIIQLGKSYAVMPATRVDHAVVVGGPYAFVRHPIYLGELMLVSSLALGLSPPLAALAIAALVGAFVYRIQCEERLLVDSKVYRDYTCRVRSRLLPGIW